jgi:hypothetical protein
MVPDIDADVNALILLRTPVVSHAQPSHGLCRGQESSYPPPPNPTFMSRCSKALGWGYPDRLNLLVRTGQ